MRKLFRELHLWLSLPIGLVISITCFTGAMLIFETEITEVIQRDYYYVDKVGKEPLPMDELMAKVEATLDEGVTIKSVVISEDEERTYKVNLSKPKRAATYVDQYTGEVKGVAERLDFFRTMFRLHRWLMDERPSDDNAIFWGKVIVGSSTLLMVIILITGAILWIPKSLKSIKYRLQISVRNGWRRFFYDLHAVGGIYATLLLLIMALTGLTWSFEWYRNGFYSLFGVELAAKSDNQMHTASNKQKGEQNGGKRNKRDSVSKETNGEAVVSQPSVYLHWDEVHREVRGLNPDAPQITISKGSASASLAGWGNKRASNKYTFDNKSGKITKSEPYADSDHAGKVRGWITSLHIGNWGGMFTRILWFAAALLGATLPLTGYYLWFKRKFCKSSAAKAKAKA